MRLNQCWTDEKRSGSAPLSDPRSRERLSVTVNICNQEMGRVVSPFLLRDLSRNGGDLSDVLRLPGELFGGKMS